jgi:predicted amidohydrolase
MRLNLVAVQVRQDMERYRSFRAFREAMSSLVVDACRSAASGCPSVIVFPEGLGLFLSLAPYYGDLMAATRTVRAAVWRVGLRRWPELLSTALRVRTIGLRTALLAHGLEAREAYYETFSELARREGVYIAAGSGFFPDVVEAPLRPTRVAGASVFNVAPLFSPSGGLLTETRKVRRASRWERRFAFAEGRVEDLHPAETAVGKIGVLICHDSLWAGNLARLDAIGTQVLAVPAYSLAPWHSEVRKARITKEEAWLDRGLPRLIEGRENIQFAVCAMLVGSVFDLRSEGMSFICRASAWSGESRLVAVAESCREEGVVVAQVELDAWPAWGPARLPG